MHLFHRWGKWQTVSVKRYWAWKDGTTSSTPISAQYRECSKCGKREINELD